jgi:hypothetical protein
MTDWKAIELALNIINKGLHEIQGGLK